MSNDLNRCEFIGRLGKDPEIRFSHDGKAIANITLTVGESWKDRNSGQRQERTEWVRCVFFGPVAQVVADYLKKGSKIFVSGKLKTRKWQNQQGQDQYTTEVVVDGFNGVMQMLDSKDSSTQSSNQNTQKQQHEQQQQYDAMRDEFDDSIPFMQHERFLL